ncbi:hypothetical protein CAOG_01900 [Capsaspora owczarzaki ATCC 30864]|uniref:hypothetical protein n=1 Tax=Capsaspora owczarzaki (strain ATCC 30864) TaxID=595528 RepID=UPI0001FE58D1|nr:hypothetical protein CAOG_01900 [Capsaspora owczarzaki ATCC 30864]|eukprot:XP_004364768.1 hypothetical protein CAOG_01900 [Capsaspora owczarzaki ATCC 30864]
MAVPAWPATEGTIEGFSEIWLSVFLWTVASTVLVYVIGGFVAFFSFNKLRLAGFLPFLFLVMGLLVSVIIGGISSVAVAGVFVSGAFPFPILQSVFYGLGLTTIYLFFTFTKLYATL